MAIILLEFTINRNTGKPIFPGINILGNGLAGTVNKQSGFLVTGYLNTINENVTNLSSGIYIVKIKSKNQIVTKKWIKM